MESRKGEREGPEELLERFGEGPDAEPSAGDELEFIPAGNGAGAGGVAEKPPENSDMPPVAAANRRENDW